MFWVRAMAYQAKAVRGGARVPDHSWVGTWWQRKKYYQRR